MRSAEELLSTNDRTTTLVVKQSFFSPKRVAQSLAVSESTIKRWCDRGIIPTVKTSGGHRRITAEGLREFIEKSSRSIVHPDVLGIVVLPANRSQYVPGSDEVQLKQFREALTAGREEECIEIFRDRISSGWSIAETAEDLIKDAMQGVGIAWENNEVDVYQERRACSICLRIISQMRRELPELRDDAPIAIGGAPSGDSYELPSAMVELALRERGWRAVNLGPNLPMTSFLQAAQDHDPSLVWISVSTISDQSEFVAAENVLANSLDDDTFLILGGRALTDQIRPQLSYTAHCDSMRHFVELASSLRTK